MKAAILLFLKGLAMGAADIVPGVSGGTIAFITGIYERLLGAISQAPKAGWCLVQGQFAKAWRTLDGNFLLVLFAGIVTSVFSLAGLIHWLLQQHGLLLWAFFFGLIVASCWLVAKQVQRWHWPQFLFLLLGIGLAAYISLAAHISWGSGLLAVFFAGAIAICAMILPGISGSFLLVLMGMYDSIISAVKSLDVVTLGVFALGCLTGILLFAHVLKFTMQHYREVTLSFLLGIMLGSLLKVWPWKETLEWQLNRHGEQVPLQQVPVSPWQYEVLTQLDAQLAGALLLAVLSVLLVLGLEYWSSRLAGAATAPTVR